MCPAKTDSISSHTLYKFSHYYCLYQTNCYGFQKENNVPCVQGLANCTVLTITAVSTRLI